MTKETRNPKSEIRKGASQGQFLAFVIRISFGFRHSTFGFNLFHGLVSSAFGLGSSRLKLYRNSRGFPLAPSATKILSWVLVKTRPMVSVRRCWTKRLGFSRYRGSKS